MNVKFCLCNVLMENALRDEVHVLFTFLATDLRGATYIAVMPSCYVSFFMLSWYVTAKVNAIIDLLIL